MLSKEVIDNLKEDGMTFEQISELNSRIETINNGSADFLDESKFWEGVKLDIKNFYQKDHKKCIK